MHEGLRGPLEREAADQVHEARLAQKADAVYGAQMQPEGAEKYHGRVGGGTFKLSVHKDREREGPCAVGAALTENVGCRRAAGTPRACGSGTRPRCALGDSR